MPCCCTEWFWTNTSFSIVITFPIHGWLDNFFMATWIRILGSFSFIFYQVPCTCMLFYALSCWFTQTFWTASSEARILWNCLLVGGHSCLHCSSPTKQRLPCCHDVRGLLPRIRHPFWVLPLWFLNHFPLWVQAKISIKTFIQACIALFLYRSLYSWIFSVIC